MVGELPRARGGSWCWLAVGRSCCAGTCGMLLAAGTCRYSTARVPRPVGVSQLVVSGWPPPVRGIRPGLTRTLLRSGGCTIAVQCKQGTPSITQATTRSLECIRNPAMRVIHASHWHAFFAVLDAIVATIATTVSCWLGLVLVARGAAGAPLSWTVR